jgi:hypothetical protein
LTNDKQPESKFLPRPGVALLITAVLVALTVQDQFSSGSVDLPLLLVDVILVMFWAGQGVDAIVGRLIR